MKVVIGGIMLIFLVFLLMIPRAISAPEPLKVLNAEGVKISSMEVIENKGAKYVQLLDVTKIFDGTVKSDPLLKRMTVTIMNNEIVLNIDRTYLRVNNEEYVISNPPVNISGKIAVPLEFLTEILPKVIGKPVKLDREKLTLQIDVKSSRVSVDKVEPQKSEVVKPLVGTFKLILDPGHGGSDIGARSESGILEKDMNLLIAQRIKDILKNEQQIEVYITRNSDDQMALEDRANFANRLHGNLFLSIHFNWSFSKNASGFRIYVNSDRVRMGTEPELGEMLSKLREGRDNASEKLRYLPQSRNLAKEIADSMNKIGLSGQYNSEAFLSMMDRLSMPGVLIELLYLSNPKDVEFISSEESINLLAQTLCDSLIAYISKYGN